MSHWRRTAIERFPQMHRVIADAGMACGFWWEMQKSLADTYRRIPFDEEFVATVYEFASWCLHHRSQHIRQSVIQCFYEDLPLNNTLRRDMARWISQEDFDLLDSDFVWEYVMTEKSLKEFRKEFAAQKAQRHNLFTRPPAQV